MRPRAARPLYMVGWCGTLHYSAPGSTATAHQTTSGMAKLGRSMLAISQLAHNEISTLKSDCYLVIWLNNVKSTKRQHNQLVIGFNQHSTKFFLWFLICKTSFRYCFAFHVTKYIIPEMLDEKHRAYINFENFVFGRSCVQYSTRF